MNLFSLAVIWIKTFYIIKPDQNLINIKSLFSTSFIPLITSSTRIFESLFIDSDITTEILKIYVSDHFSVHYVN